MSSKEKKNFLLFLLLIWLQKMNNFTIDLHLFL